MLEAAFVRSAEPHALIRHVDAAAARALPGVHAALTLDDLRPHITTERLAVGLPSPAYRQQVDRMILAGDEVVHVGEPIAIVVAESRYVAEDAAARGRARRRWWMGATSRCRPEAIAAPRSPTMRRACIARRRTISPPNSSSA